eukprot:1808692-Pyramimonas_sp.AAC.1
MALLMTNRLNSLCEKRTRKRRQRYVPLRPLQKQEKLRPSQTDLNQPQGKDRTICLMRMILL